MFAQTPQYRPEIARVAEETVLNLKQLESRIDVLKNDLAALCTVLGHPEAARIAVTPPSWLGITPHSSSYGNIGVQGPGSLGSLGATPFQGSLPVSPWTQGVSPVQPWTQGVSPVQPWTQGLSPFGAPVSPFVQGINPYTQQGINPYTQGFSPYGQSFGMGTVPFGTYGSLPPQYPPIR